MTEIKIQGESAETTETLNKRWQKFIESFELWHKFLQASANVNFTYDKDIDFDKKITVENVETPTGNDQNSFVFIAKQISRLDILNKADQSLPAAEAISAGKTAVVHFDHLQLKHRTQPLENGNTLQSFTVSNVKLSYLHNDPRVVNMAMQELAKACWIAGHAAKLTGMGPVDAGDTTDPVIRYMIHAICEELEIECTETKPLIMPSHEKIPQGFDQLCNTAMKSVRNNIDRPTVIDGKATQPAPEPERAPLSAVNDDFKSRLRNRARTLKVS